MRAIGVSTSCRICSRSCWTGRRSFRPSTRSRCTRTTQPEVQRANAAHGIITQAWSPIGGITSYGGGGSSTVDDPVIAQIASEEALSRRT